MKWRVINTLLLLSIFLMGCSVKQNMNKQRFVVIDNFVKQKELKAQDRVFAFNFRGWNALDDFYLIVESGLNKNYLLKLEGFCQDLSYASQIKLNQSNTNQLQTHFDSVSVVRQNFPQKCRIDKIYLLNRELKNELITVYKEKK